MHLLGLRSEENVADDPSRGRRASDEAIRKTVQTMCRAQLEYGLKGVRLNEYNPSKAPARHVSTVADPSLDADMTLEEALEELYTQDPTLTP